MRDKAALLLGRMVTSLAPGEHADALRNGRERLSDYPAVTSLIDELRTRVLTFGTLDEATLLSGSPCLDAETDQ